MSDNPGKSRVLDIGVATCAAMALAVLVLGTENGIITAQSSNFQGGSPEVSEAPDMRSVRILFPAGVRSNWHTHTWGQLLMIEEGIGLHQVRGAPIEEMHPGEPWWTPRDVEHWHGAHPETDALQITIYEGSVNWMEAVTDEQYGGERVRPPTR